MAKTKTPEAKLTIRWRYELEKHTRTLRVSVHRDALVDAGAAQLPRIEPSIGV